VRTTRLRASKTVPILDFAYLKVLTEIGDRSRSRSANRSGGTSGGGGGGSTQMGLKLLGIGGTARVYEGR
jgi:hypothetical protein